MLASAPFAATAVALEESDDLPSMLAASNVPLPLSSARSTPPPSRSRPPRMSTRPRSASRLSAPRISRPRTRQSRSPRATRTTTWQEISDSTSSLRSEESPSRCSSPTPVSLRLRLYSGQWHTRLPRSSTRTSPPPRFKVSLHIRLDLAISTPAFRGSSTLPRPSNASE